jgi:hypothetical protein
MVSVSGCTPKPIGPTGTEDDAEELLTVALDSWKAGFDPAALQEESPAIHIADEDWQAGAILKEYKFTGNAVKYGGTWRVPALLTLSDGGESTSEKKAAYEVTMDPAITILRADENFD